MRAHENSPHRYLAVLIIQQTQQHPVGQFKFMGFIKVGHNYRFLRGKRGSKRRQGISGLLCVFLVVFHGISLYFKIGKVWIPIFVALGTRDGFHCWREWHSSQLLTSIEFQGKIQVEMIY